MVNGRATALLHYLEDLSLAAGAERLADGELVRRFLADRDGRAFAELVRRHGPMVLRVGRRVLRNEHDAEDVFQATFLVLSRKAHSVRSRSSVASWLYGVAYRLALKARANADRRRAVEGQAAPPCRVQPLEEMSMREAQAILDEEIVRLPEKYRTSLVLCCLEGKARDEAARVLGVRLRTLKGRLEKARERLRDRLTRRGVLLSLPLLATHLAGDAAAVSPRLVHTTVQVALETVAGKAATGLVSAGAAALAEGMVKVMFVSKLKLVAAVSLVIALVGVGVCSHAALGAKQNGEPVAPQAEAKQAAAPEEEPAKDKGQTGAFVVTGRVTDSTERRRPVEGAVVTASCGVGTLFRTGSATTGKDGRYELRFGPGMAFAGGKVGVQAATIYVRKPGYFEQNLCRDGGLLMADADIPAKEWKSYRGYAGVVLPGKPYKVNFALAPAAQLSGRLRDAQGRPLAKKKVYLDGQRLYPSTSVLATAETDEQGRFRVADVPLSSYVINVSLPELKTDLACGVVPFKRPGLHEVEITLNEVSPQRWSVTTRVDTEPKQP